MLLDATHTLADSIGASSTHILFHPQNQAAPLTRKGFDARSSFQYHWECAPHWSAFEDYLQDMRASSRKQIRRERRLAQSHGLTLRTLRGEEFSPTHWSALWRFYRTNAYFKGAIPYLSEAFFSYLRTHLSDYVLGTFAESEQGPVAGALFFCAGDQLFGRYWGTERYMECMHFELCYYQPIEWAITHGIRRFEAGAQGDHKLKRDLPGQFVFHGGGGVLAKSGDLLFIPHKPAVPAKRSGAGVRCRAFCAHRASGFILDLNQKFVYTLRLSLPSIV